MNTKLYRWLLFFLGLYTASALLQSILRFLLGGPQLILLDTFDSWFLLTNITASIGSILLLKYYYTKKFWFVFVTGVLSTGCSLCYAIVFYTILNFHKLAGYNVPLLFLSFVTGIIYGISLISLRAKNKRWLRAAGLLQLIIGLILLSSFIWGIASPSPANGNTIERISQWVSLAGCLFPIFLIVHFSRELPDAGANSTNTRAQRRLQTVIGIAGIIGLTLTLTVGVMISFESYSTMHWTNWNYTKTKEFVQSFDPGIFVNSKGDTLRYRLLKPLDYDPGKKYPIVISLPYGGQPATDTIAQLEGAVAAELLATDNNRREHPAFLFIPNCPPGAGWGGIPYYPEADSLVFDALIALDRQFSIDDKRRYVAGLSRGGYGAWNFICKHPEMFAAAIPVAGGGDPRLAPKIIHVAVWAFHGTEDRNVPVAGSRNMIDAIKRAGGNPKYTEFPGEGHNIWDKVIATPGLLDWLFAQHHD
ncbi:MAG TPA: alpha/beta hydrolase-fold protein [Puia sp.]|jgi:hypothetical protein